MDIREFKNIYKEYSPCIVWDWCAKPTAEEIDKSLRRFSKYGIADIFVRPSKGLAVRYLSDEFFELVRTAARRSEKYSLRLWLFDENSAFGGSGGGEITSVADYCLRDVLSICEKDAIKGDINLSSDLYLRDMSKQLSSKRAPLADITDFFVTNAFADFVYGSYLRECKRFVGNEICGFLTQINMPENALLFSRSALKKAGLDSSDLKSEDFSKKEYNEAFSDCIAENYTGVLEEKCHKNNMRLFVDVGGSSFVSRQMQYLKGDCVSVMLTSQNTDLISFKLAESICAQFDKPLTARLLLGSYESSSKRYAFSSAVAAMGASRICYDSVAFSLADRRKYESNTVVLSDFTENDISKRISRFCNVTKNTSSPVSLLLVCRSENAQKLLPLGKKLLSMGIPFHVCEDCVLKKHGSFSHGSVTLGKYRYTSLIFTDEIDIPQSFLGETLYYEDALKSNLSVFKNASLLPVSSDNELFINYREDSSSQYVFLTASESDCRVTVMQGEKNLYLADASNGEIYSLPFVDGSCIFTLRAGKTALLISSGSVPSQEFVPFTGDIELLSPKKDNVLPFVLAGADDNIYPLKRVNACFGKKAYRESNTDDLHREFYRLPDNEIVKAKYPFFVNLEKIGKVSLCAEYADNMDSVALNGKTLAGFLPSEKDPRFMLLDVTAFLADGKNTFSLEYRKFNNYTPDFSSNAPHHFYSFNPTSFEPLFLCGDFDCEDGILTRISDYSDDVSESGMPYYYGALTYAVKLPDEDLSNTLFSVCGDYDVCRIKIGKREKLFFENNPFIEVFNLDGGETVQITIFNTPYNLLRSSKESARPFGLKEASLYKF